MTKHPPLKYAVEQENWNTYILEDGAIVRMKLVLVRICRTGTDQNGAPIYEWECPHLVQIEAPESASQQQDHNHG
jgi:hypothetical protein